MDASQWCAAPYRLSVHNVGTARSRCAPAYGQVLGRSEHRIVNNPRVYSHTYTSSATYQRLAAALLVLLLLSARSLCVAAPSLAAPPTAGAASIGAGMLCALALLGTASTLCLVDGTAPWVDHGTHRLDAGQCFETHACAGV